MAVESGGMMVMLIMMVMVETTIPKRPMTQRNNLDDPWVPVVS